MKTQLSQVLADKSASGKTRNWALHKLHSGYISLAYEEIDPKKSERMKTCAQWLSFFRKEDGTMKLHDARFCRVRLCPVCQWRRSLKTFAQMSQVLDLAKGQGYQFIFLTLTMQNCKSEELSDELSHILLSFNRLMKYKDVQKAVKGYYRGCEVTHNVHTDEFHPHIHAILAVNGSYFGGSYYLSQARWTELWKRALQVDYTPIVDVRRCKGGTKAIAEACKYTVKPSDILNFDDWDMTVDTLRVLDKALENRRFVGLGGVIKDIHKKLHLDDIEDGDLVHVETDPDGSEPSAEEIVYFWNGYGQYIRE
jgi:plasmid rolling circle replication initiator protein Rep